MVRNRLEDGRAVATGEQEVIPSGTVAALLQDLARGGWRCRRRTPARRGCGRGCRARDPRGWEAIDAHERGLGAPAGRPRVKLVRVPEMLAVAAPHDS